MLEDQRIVGTGPPAPHTLAMGISGTDIASLTLIGSRGLFTTGQSQMVFGYYTNVIIQNVVILHISNWGRRQRTCLMRATEGVRFATNLSVRMVMR